MHLRNIEIFDGEQRLDLGARTDGQPDYEGWAPAGSAEDAIAWIIAKNTFTTVGGSDIRTKRQMILKGSWTLRATYF